MGIIHARSSQRRKPSKPTVAQRALEADYKAMLARHAKPLEKGLGGKKVKKVAALLDVDFAKVVRPPPAIPSRVTPGGDATKKMAHKYTGDKMLGIGQMAKSNAIPIFEKEFIVDVARMRR